MLNQCFARHGRYRCHLNGKSIKPLDELLLLGILKPVEAGGVDNCSPVVWVKKGDKLRMCVDYKVHVNDKIGTEAYPSLVLKPLSQKCQALNSLQKLIYLMLISEFHLMENRNMCVQ